MIVPRFVLQSTSAAADQFFDNRTGDMFITEFGAAEVSSGIARMRRMGELDLTSGWDAMNEFDGFRRRIKAVEITPADYVVAHAHVRLYDLKLRAPDALHLAVAQRLCLTLVTLDKRLAAAARALGAAVE